MPAPRHGRISGSTPGGSLHPPGGPDNGPVLGVLALHERVHAAAGEATLRGLSTACTEGLRRPGVCRTVRRVIGGRAAVQVMGLTMVAVCAGGVMAGCSRDRGEAGPGATQSSATTDAAPPSSTPTIPPSGPSASGTAPSSTADGTTSPVGRRYPVHTSIVATTFWVGEVFDPHADDGSQVLSTYDDDWMANYGGCDGIVVADDCRTERRTAANHFFPTRMTPRENPFYLDLPFDDVNDPAAAARRASVVPWAHDPGWAEKLADPDQSIMKNRWVAVRKGSQVCYAQIQDAGPGEYDDAEYVFGTDDARPKNERYNGAGMDVSPALNGCLGFSDLNGEDDRVDWWFVDDADVPDGPWSIVVTR
jgi:hypothetical protein